VAAGRGRRSPPTARDELRSRQIVRESSAAKGAWLNDHTFLMSRLTLGLGPAQLWTFAFDGDSLNVLVALPSGTEVSIDGKTGE
jgi:hypothetical protein